MNAEEIISLQSHTIGSIGQVIKCMELANNLSKEKALDEIERIYKGYISRITQLTNK